MPSTPDNDDCELRMFFVRDSALAVQVSDGDTPERTSKLCWILRSLIRRSLKTGDLEHLELYPRFDFTLPEWKVQELNLWAWVKE